jgi:3-oxoacyl-[acyl-carrier-protein] synthase II
MHRNNRRVAVTGVGVVTALGSGREENWRRLTGGEPGVHAITRFDTAEMPTRFAACVTSMGTDDMPSYARTYEMADHVAAEAMSQSGLGRPECARGRIFLAVSPGEVEWDARLACRRSSAVRDRPPSIFEMLREAPEELRARLFRSGLVTILGDQLAALYGMEQPSLAVNTACASGASAIDLAVHAIRRKESAVALALGADSTIWPEGVLRFSLLSALSTRNDSPETASRPFSADRDGFVIGEGAAALVLEDEEHARARGATILGYVLGSGNATDNFHRTRSHPSGDTIVASMRRALDDADVPPHAVHYINAHGTSTPENDKMEALGIERLFAGHPIAVSSNKSMIGHTLTACGAVEAAFTVLTLERGVLPPTINHERPDPTIHLDVVPNVARRAQAGVALSNSFGFGGQNVSLLFGHADAGARP